MHTRMFNGKQNKIAFVYEIKSALGFDLCTAIDSEQGVASNRERGKVRAKFDTNYG
jgi:hypothetical protein